MAYRVRGYRTRVDARCDCGRPTYRGERVFEIIAPDGTAMEAGFCSRPCAKAAAKAAEWHDTRCGECGGVLDDGFSPAVCFGCADVRAWGAA